MDCIQARDILWPPDRPRLLRGDVAAAQAHIRACDDCREYFSQDRELLALYDEVRRSPAPVSLRARVAGAIEGARSVQAPPSPWSRRHSVTAAAALGVVLLGALASALLKAPAPERLSGDDPDVFVEDYLRRAVAGDFIETDDPVEVTRFLQKELGIRLEPLQSATLTLTRAEICLLEGRRGAMIMYDRGGAEVSHYLIPREDAVERAPALVRGGTGSGASDMPVVTWGGSRVEQALVGEVESDVLLALATAYRAER